MREICMQKQRSPPRRKGSKQQQQQRETPLNFEQKETQWERRDGSCCFLHWLAGLREAECESRNRQAGTAPLPRI
jgi:hypothetical protein